MSSRPTFEKLFEPFRLGNMPLKNRIVMPAMVTDYGTEDGYVTERLKAYHEERARGGVGLIILECICVDSPVGKRPGCQLVIDDDRFIPGLTGLVQAIQPYGAKVAAQLHHAGGVARSGLTGTPPVAPSAIAQPGGEMPRELGLGEIPDLVAKFARAAKRAQRAGFNGLEIHAAHGYLIAQFLSAAFNKRRDAYGGELKNRARLLLEILKAIRETVGPDYPVWCRINGEETGLAGGFPLSEAKELAQMLQSAGADAIHVSNMAWGPGTVPPMDQPLGSNVPLAAEIKKGTTLPVIVVRRLEPELGEKVLQEGKADLIAMGRALIADPELPNKAASGRADEIRSCLGCNMCLFSIFQGEELHCVVNPTVGREKEYRITPAEKKKRVTIIGGGPAGMEAARVAALRGHRVTLYEKGDRLGGQLLLAAKPPHKSGIERLTIFLTRQVEKLGIQVELQKEATPAIVQNSDPDLLILAAGSKPILPKIKGMDRKKPVLFADLLSGKAEVGQKVIVIGGGFVGCETADFLAEKGKKVTVIEILPDLLQETYYPQASLLADLLVREMREKGVEIFTGVKEEEITDKGMEIVDQEGKRISVEADDIVAAIGSVADQTLFESVRGKAGAVCFAGDCVKPRNIMEAVHDGYRMGYQA